MGVGKIIQLVGVLVAVIAGLIGGFNYSDLLIALLGLAGGYFVAADDRSRFLIATLALIAVNQSLGGIPAVGGYLSGALGGLAALFSAGAITAIVMGVVEALMPGGGSD